MRLISIWGQVQRDWGYEVRVDLADDADNIIHEILVFPSVPSQSEIDMKIAELIDRYTSETDLNY